jgi:hypothetical protein
MLPILDHVTVVVADAAAYTAALRSDHGLGSFDGGHLDHLGARSFSVPLAPPSYLELLAVDDEPADGTTPLGRRVLDLRDAGGGLIAWTVRVGDLDAVSRRVGVDVYEGSTRVVSGALRRWRTVTGADHLPIFISYPDDPEDERTQRWRGTYDWVAHTSAPGGFTALDVGGDRAEYEEWLGPHDLPLRYVPGPPGLRSVTIATTAGDVVVR